MRFAHLADIHLGYEQYNQLWRAEDFAKAFRLAVERSLEENVDFAIIAGDLFHRSLPNPRTIKDAIDTLSLFKKEGIPVFAVEGNHDKTSRDISAYHLLESLGLLHVLGLRKNPVDGEYVRSVRIQNVYLVKGVYEDVEILGDRHRSKWQLEKVLPILKPESDKSVLVLHQAVKEVVDIELDMAFDVTLSELPEASYYAFGHIHLPRIYEFDGKFLVYPGSLERYDLREASYKIFHGSERVVKGVSKGFVVVDGFKPKFIEIETRDLYDVSIEAEDLKELERKFMEVLKGVNREGILIAKLKCPHTPDLKKLSEVAQKNAKYAELRFERVVEKVEEVVIQSENEFFTDFELKLLELLKDDVDEVYGFVKEHFELDGKKEEKAEEKTETESEPEPAGTAEVETEEVETETEVKAKTEAKRKTAKTLLDFFGGE